ncbi:MAG: PEGA domain-containing protein [Bradymonadia bacterium]
MKWVSLCVAWLAFATGCATIIEGSKQSLSVNSSVTGAEVVMNGEVIGVTPLTRKIEKDSNDATIIVRKEGYVEQSFSLNSKVTVAFWGNILCGGTFGSTTDAATGAMYEFAPSNLFADLKPVAMTPEQEQNWIAEQRLRAFVLLNHEPLVRELSVGEGQYVDALMTMLSVTDGERPVAVDHLQQVWLQSGTLVEFAERVLEARAA